tara:strand:+ start:95 stop:418 length:324 start_codon:yes stop_codon:yes gene_type:complete
MARFTNQNVCNAYATYLKGTGIHKLSAAECTEVVFVNNTANPVLVYDNPVYGSAAVANVRRYVEVPAGEQFTFRGVTDSDSLSAASTATGNDTVTYRTQFYSSFPQR